MSLIVKPTSVTASVVLGRVVLVVRADNQEHNQQFTIEPPDPAQLIRDLSDAQEASQVEADKS